jgi:adenylate cyclase class 2
MPDQQEVEIKFVLQAPDVIREKLVGLGAIPHGRHTELNIRLDDSTHSLTGHGIVLRLRRLETADGKVNHLLTVKTPGAGDNVDFSVRREIELEVSDGTAMLSALEVLGYSPYWCYEKRREVFSIGSVEAVIDEMPYGWFLELEGPPSDIRVLAGELGFDMADGLTLSYAQIFDNVRRALQLDITDLTFEAFKGISVDPQAYRGT